jgi:hypothetical protein
MFTLQNSDKKKRMRARIQQLTQDVQGQKGDHDVTRQTSQKYFPANFAPTRNDIMGKGGEVHVKIKKLNILNRFFTQ